MLPSADIVTAQDVGLRSTPDPEILEYTAATGRILLTHDEETMPRYAIERVRRGLPMPGVIVVAWGSPIAAAAEDLAIALECSVEGEHEGQVLYLPWPSAPPSR
jgi:hypothetical protein